MCLKCEKVYKNSSHYGDMLMSDRMD